MPPWQKSHSEKKTLSYENVKLGTCRSEAVQLSAALCIQIGKIASGSQFWTTFFSAWGPSRQCTQMSDWLPKEDKNLNWPHFLWKQREILLSLETLSMIISIGASEAPKMERVELGSVKPAVIKLQQKVVFKLSSNWEKQFQNLAPSSCFLEGLLANCIIQGVLYNGH